MNRQESQTVERFLAIDLHPGPCVQDGQALPRGGRGRCSARTSAVASACGSRELVALVPGQPGAE
jgi:hypothetical protein